MGETTLVNWATRLSEKLVRSNPVIQDIRQRVFYTGVIFKTEESWTMLFHICAIFLGLGELDKGILHPGVIFGTGES